MPKKRPSKIEPDAKPPYFLIEPFELTFEQAKAGIDRAVRLMTNDEYREYLDRLWLMGPDMVEIVEIDQYGNRRKLKPEEYPCFRARGLGKSEPPSS